jgi:hypothetical protein
MRLATIFYLAVTIAVIETWLVFLRWRLRLMVGKRDGR